MPKSQADNSQATVAPASGAARAQAASRIEFVDTARGIAMLCIVLGHLGLGPVNAVVYTFHVPIFFLITGWFISRKQDVATFVRKRARSLLVPYAATAAFVLLGIVLIAGAKAALGLPAAEGEIGARGVGGEALNWLVAALYGNGTAWRLPAGVTEAGAIWFLWACFWGCAGLRVLLELKSEWLRALIAAVVAVACAYTGEHLIMLPLSLQPGGIALGYMYLGHLARTLLPRAQALPRPAKIAGVVAAFAGWALLICAHEDIVITRCAIGRSPLSIVGVLCACFCVVFIAWAITRTLPRVGRALGFFGKYSLVVLCVHLTEMVLINYANAVGALMGAGLPYLVAGGLTFCLKFGIILGATVALVHWNPARKLFGFAPLRPGERA